MKKYKDVSYRVVTDLDQNNREVFCIDIRRSFLFIPYWTRWELTSAGLFIASITKMEFSSAKKAEEALMKKVDEVNARKEFKSKEII